MLRALRHGDVAAVKSLLANGQAVCYCESSRNLPKILNQKEGSLDYVGDSD